MKLEQKFFAIDEFDDKDTNTERVDMLGKEVQTEDTEDHSSWHSSRQSQTFLEDARVHISEYQKQVQYHTERLFAQCHILAQELSAAIQNHPAAVEIANRIAQAREVRLIQIIDVVQDGVEEGGSALLNLLTNALTHTFSRQKTMSEQDEASDLLFKRKGRQSRGKTVKLLQSYDKDVKNICEKVARYSGRNLKNVLMKSELLKVIQELYEERLVWGQHESVKGMTMAVFVYAETLRKHVQPKIAELKFEQVLASALKHQRHPRIHTFARFLGLFSPLSAVDLDHYISAYGRLKAYSDGLANEIAVVQLPVTLSLAKSTFEGKIPDYESLYSQLCALEPMPNSQTDTLLEPVLHLISHMFRSEAETQFSFLTHIYDSVDLHNSAYVEISDFLLLCHHLSARRISDVEAKVLFGEFADISLDGSGDHCDGLSFFNFQEMATSVQLFTPESYNRFAKTDSLEHSLKTYINDLPRNVGEMKWRIKQMQGGRGYALQRYFQTIVEKIKESKAEAVWLAVRIAQEETKEGVADRITEKLMPAIAKRLSIG